MIKERAQASNRRSLRPGALLRLFIRFRSHLRPHRRKLVAAAACMIGVTALEIARPWPLKFIFDGLLIPQDEPDRMIRLANHWTGGGDALLLASAAAILAIAILGGLLGFGQSYLLAQVGQHVVSSIRLQLYSHIQRLSHSFHDEQSSGDLLARLTGDVRMMRELLTNSMVYISARILVVVGTLAVMASMDWRLTCVALVILPFLVASVFKFGGEIKGAARRQRRKESKVAQVVAESINTIRVVQAFAREAYEEDRFARQNNSSVQAGLRATRLEAHLDRLVQVILAAGTCGVIWYGVTRVRVGVLTPGDLLVFTAYLTTLYKPIRKLAGLTGRIAKATACGERIIAILELEPEIADAPDAREAPCFAGEVEFDHVRFGYAGRKPLLKEFSLPIAAGERVALVGPSGAGKSTLANLILRFYDPQQGSVRIDGKDIRSFTLESLRKQVAIVLQDSPLFAGSIRDNIAYGRLDASDEEIAEAARIAQAHDFIEALPEGYDTEVGERGATLSGGERQRIAIARAIVRDAAIVILDEPTTGLDQASKATVSQALRNLTENRTCLLITHDPLDAGDFDRVLQIRDGRLQDDHATHPDPRPYSPLLPERVRSC